MSDFILQNVRGSGGRAVTSGTMQLLKKYLPMLITRGRAGKAATGVNRLGQPWSLKN